MIPFVLTKARPNTFSTLYSENPWFDRLRGIRRDHKRGGWLLSTSEGFFTLRDFSAKPSKWDYQPSVSPMGINGFTQRKDGSWLIGSFSGLFEVHPEEKDAIRNYFTGEVVREVKMGPPVGSYTVSGIFTGESADNDYIFLYDQGAVRRAKHQPSAIQRSPLCAPTRGPQYSSVLAVASCIRASRRASLPPILRQVGHGTLYLLIRSYFRHRPHHWTTSAEQE